MRVAGPFSLRNAPRRHGDKQSMRVFVRTANPSLSVFDDAAVASQKLTQAGITPQSLAAKFPGAFVRRLHTVLTRVHVGVDPRQHDFSAIQAWLKETGAAHGLDVRAEPAPARECCKAGCSGCLTNTGAPKALRHQWLKASATPSTKTGYSERSFCERKEPAWHLACIQKSSRAV